VALADSNFFRVFDFPLVKGDPRSALSGPANVVLSETVAKKFFGSTDPMGKVLRLSRGKYPCTVTGIIKDMPENSHFKASMIIAVPTFERMDTSLNSEWDNYSWTAYALLKPDASAVELQAKFPAYLDKVGGAALRKTKMTPTLLLEPLRDIYLYSSRDDARNGHIGNVYIFSIIGFFIILIAGINSVTLRCERSEPRRATARTLRPSILRGAASPRTSG